MRKSKIYTPELAAAICERLAAGESLRSISRSEGMPADTTVHEWIINDREGFAVQYARARDVGYKKLADELVDIADDGANDYIEHEGQSLLNAEHVQRSKLRVDTRKWILSKMLPKIYDDKSEVDLQVTANQSLADRLRAARKNTG